MATLTLNENIDRIENAKASIKTAIEAKGVVVPAEIKLDGYAAKIDEIQAGGGGGGSFDWEGTGYSPEEEGKVYTKMQADIEYTKQKFAEWDPSGTSASNLYKEDNKLAYAPAIDTSKVTNMYGMFYDCYALTSVPEFNTSKVTNMNSMFGNCSALTTVPLFDTSAVTNMSYMFSSCSALTSVPLLDTSKVTSMSEMFSSCSALANIPLFDTSAVTDMNNMFYYCEVLTTVPQFNTSQVTNMSFMFYDCYALTSVPEFNTSKVTNMYGMFYDCNALTSVEFKGGVAPGCDCTDMFPIDLDTTGVLKVHVGNGITKANYQPVIDALPSTWTVEEIEDPVA